MTVVQRVKESKDLAFQSDNEVELLRQSSFSFFIAL